MRLYLQERPVTPLYLDVDASIRKSDDDGGKIPGMEGPFTFRGGRTLHYDPKEGKYYDRGKDMYLDHEEASDATSSYGREATKPKVTGGGGTQTGPRGGTYTMSSSGKKVYKGIDLYLDLSKAGGEGSRGGDVIGHTPSGKPIYAPSQKLLDHSAVQHPDNTGAQFHLAEQHIKDTAKDYTKEDHYHAAVAHEAMWDKLPRDAHGAKKLHNIIKTAHKGKMTFAESKEFAKQAKQANKSIGLYLDLAKGGEGSRGGKVIGHTQSGKPIYQHKPNLDSTSAGGIHGKEFRGWGAQDHKDAYAAHGEFMKDPANSHEDRVASMHNMDAHWYHAKKLGDPLPKVEVKARSQGPMTWRQDKTEKGNPHRDPTVGHFISGGAGKAMNGKGQQDMDEFMNSLMDKLPGDDLDKDKP